MPRLTSQLLDNYPYSKYASAQTIQRGRTYYKDGNVWSTDLVNDQKAVCFVNGDSGEYTVEIEIDKKSGELTFECDCYYAEDGNFCKHMIAAAMEVSEYLRDEEADEDYEEEFEPPAPKTKEPVYDWKAKLMQSVTLMPRQSTAGSNRILHYLTRKKYGFSYYSNGQQYSYTLEPFVVKENTWAPLQELESPTAESVNNLLEKNKTWIKTGETVYNLLNPKGCVNASEEAIAFIGLARNIGSIYGNVSGHLNNYLSILSKLDVPIFLGSTRYPEKIERRLYIQPDPIKIQIDMRRTTKNSACKRVSTRTEPSPISKRKSK